MKLLSICTVSVLLLVGCAPSNELAPISQIPAGVATQGSLANDQLTSDAEAGLSQIVPNYDKLTKFVIQRPVGTKGSMAWRELWMVDVNGQSSSFIITFREDGQGGAFFEIDAT